MRIIQEIKILKLLEDFLFLVKREYNLRTFIYVLIILYM